MFSASIKSLYAPADLHSFDIIKNLSLARDDRGRHMPRQASPENDNDWRAGLARTVAPIARAVSKAKSRWMVILSGGVCSVESNPS